MRRKFFTIMILGLVGWLGSSLKSNQEKWQGVKELDESTEGPLYICCWFLDVDEAWILSFWEYSRRENMKWQWRDQLVVLMTPGQPSDRPNNNSKKARKDSQLNAGKTPQIVRRYLNKYDMIIIYMIIIRHSNAKTYIFRTGTLWNVFLWTLPREVIKKMTDLKYLWKDLLYFSLECESLILGIEWIISSDKSQRSEKAWYGLWLFTSSDVSNKCASNTVADSFATGILST